MKIPKPAELNPRLSELETKRNALHAEKAGKVAEAAIIRARIQESPSTGNAAENRIRAILGEPSLPNAAPDIARLEQLLLELNDLNRAIGILDGAIEKERNVASRMVCDAVRPEVLRLGKRFAKTLLDLYAAQDEYHSYLDAVEDTGARVGSLGRIWINGLGSVRDPCGGFHYAMREFVDAGCLTRSAIPEAVR